ncbi:MULTISPECIES: hypothetical protein [Rhodococcus]|uniref:LSM domain-containing protein n=2 Tax=Rhodococcus erythropolis group TaxID=2840174 RepID=A0AAW6LMA1_RHOSG|nr:hypothetical protein [Rhodococcus qingshengii]MDE8646491.1 hypothetical protein [Rhodococcus qingshengii]
MLGNVKCSHPRGYLHGEVLAMDAAMNLITAKVDDFENVREGVPGSSLVGGGYVPL